MRRSIDPCWDCVKGRHLICTGGGCDCPVDHGDSRAHETSAIGLPTCQPVWVDLGGFYVSPLEIIDSPVGDPLTEGPPTG